MKMSEEMAVRLHRMMWSDMRRELGDTPDASDRNKFKEKWCKTHFPEEYIHLNCFLCDYCGYDYSYNSCDKCPIKWPDGVCSRAFTLPPVKVDYRFAPISEILALPTRNKELADEKEQYKNGWYYEYGGLPAYFAIADHVKAIQEKASNEKDMEILRKTCMQLTDKLDRYKDALSKASDLDRHRPVDDHIREIVKNSMEFGAAEERDRIQEKIEELLS